MAKLGNDKMDIDSLMDMYSKDGVIAYDGKQLLWLSDNLGPFHEAVCLLHHSSWSWSSWKTMASS